MNTKTNEAVGGAMFCDELLANDPEALKKLKAQGKTLHGLYKYAESVAYAQAFAIHTETKDREVGVFTSVTDMLAKYLSPDIKEGYTVPKPNKPKDDPAKAKLKKAKPEDVLKVVKKAAQDAKTEKKSEPDLFSKPEEKKPEPAPKKEQKPEPKKEEQKPAFEQLSLF